MAGFYSVSDYVSIGAEIVSIFLFGVSVLPFRLFPNSVPLVSP